MPAARTTDPDTSHAAARTAHDPTEVQQHLLDLLRRDAPAGSDGLIDDNIYPKYVDEARRNGWPIPTPQSIRSRRSELVRSGKVEHSGKYGCTISGRTARKWRAAS